MLVIEDGTRVHLLPQAQPQALSNHPVLRSLQLGAYFESPEALREAHPNAPSNVVGRMKYTFEFSDILEVNVGHVFPLLELTVRGVGGHIENYKLTPHGRQPYFGSFRRPEPLRFAQAANRFIRRAQDAGAKLFPGWASQPLLGVEKGVTMPTEAKDGEYRTAGVRGERFLAHQRTGTWSRLLGSLAGVAIPHELIVTEQWLYQRDHSRVWRTPIRRDVVSLVAPKHFCLGQCFVVVVPGDGPVSELLTDWANRGA